MKYNSFLKLLTFAFFCAFIATSCVKEGPPGLDGTNGTNGTNGQNGANGADGTAFCLNCHNDNTMGAIETEWSNSVHAKGGHAARASSADCARCHAEEGFIAFTDNPKMAAVGITNANQITCKACHNGLHVTFDAENDGEDFALRNKGPVEIIIDPGQYIDLNSKESNLCVNCHQVRTPAPEDENQYNSDDELIDPAGDGMYTITSSHYGPHHAPQGNLIIGKAGYQFMGNTDYPISGNTSTPHAQAGCVACHMYEATDHPSHTFAPLKEACAECHGAVTSFDIDGVQTEVDGLMAELETLLEEDGVLVNGSLKTGTYPLKQARAYYNFAMIEEERSHGVHNPDYVRALLKNTIEALQ